MTSSRPKWPCAVATASNTASRSVTSTRRGNTLSPYASSRSASDSGLRTDAATLSPRPRAPSAHALVTTARVIILPQDLKDGAEDEFSGPRRERTVDHLVIKPSQILANQRLGDSLVAEFGEEPTNSGP